MKFYFSRLDGRKYPSKSYREFKKDRYENISFLFFNRKPRRMTLNTRYYILKEREDNDNFQRLKKTFPKIKTSLYEQMLWKNMWKKILKNRGF